MTFTLISYNFECAFKAKIMVIVNNKKNGQFEFSTELHLAYVTYRILKNTMYFMHTAVPDELSGKGIASALALEALKYARSNNYKIALLCPFVSNYVKKHPEWYDLIDVKYHTKF